MVLAVQLSKHSGRDQSPSSQAMTMLISAGVALLLLLTTRHACAQPTDLEKRREQILKMHEKDRTVEARERALKLMQSVEEKYGIGHPETAIALELLAVLADDPPLAHGYMSRAIAIYQKALGDQNPMVANALELLVQIKAFSSDTEPLLRRALGIRDAQETPDVERTCRTIALLQGFLIIHNRADELRLLAERVKVC